MNIFLPLQQYAKNHANQPPLSKLDHILQRAHMRTNINLDDIAGLQKLRLLHGIPDTRTRARHEHSALLERGTLTAVRDERRDLEAQVINTRVLS